MNRMIALSSIATAAIVTCQALSLADNPPAAPPSDASAPRTATDSARPGDAGVSNKATPGSLISRGDVSEKEFDVQFVKHASISNKTEIEIAKIAEKKTQDPQIKAFAQMLIRDHEQAEAQLKQIAQSKGINIAAPFDEVSTAKMASAQRATGPDFDRHFVFCMAGDHLTTLLWCRASSRMLQDPQLKQYAEDAIPTLRNHLREAKQLAGIDDEATTAGAHLPGSDATPAPTPSH